MKSSFLVLCFLALTLSLSAEQKRPSSFQKPSIHQKEYQAACNCGCKKAKKTEENQTNPPAN